MEKKAHILIVEDELIVAENMKQCLDRLGYGVSDVVVSGEEATEKAQELKPDLVLMDIVLRGAMDGIESADQIRTRLDIPVVYVSANANEKLLERAKRTEPFGYILKPHDDRELQVVIEVALYKHRMEKELRASEKKYSTLVEKGNDGIVIIQDGLIKFVNSRMVEITGYRKEEVLEKPVVEFVAPEFKEKTRELYQRSTSGEKIPENYVIELLSKEGQNISVEINGSRIEYEGLPADMAIIRDITERRKNEEEIRRYQEHLEDLVKERTDRLKKVNTKLQKDIAERKRAEEALATTKAFLTTAIEQSPAGVIISDAPEGTVRMANQTALRIRGKTRRRLITIPWSLHAKNWQFYYPDGTLFSPEDLPLYRAIKFGETFQDVEMFIKQDEGDKRWILLNAAPITNSEGEIIAGISVFDDITEYRHTKEALQESEKLAAQGRMAAGIAHEINNPLGGIKNSFRLIKDAVPADHAYYHYVGRIEKEIDRIARIVHHMYELYKPDGERVTEVSVNNLIQDIVSLLEVNCRTLGVSVTTKISRAPLVVNLPRNQVTQVLFNVIKNGIEASENGGGVEIRAAVVNNTLRFSVADHGLGIPKDVQRRIFEPFFTTKSHIETGGLGLGLSVSKSMVEAMGGRINFKSKRDKGTVFSISLPLNPPKVDERDSNP